MTKKEALANYLSADVKKIDRKSRDYYTYNREEYLVLDKDDVYDYVYDCIKRLVNEVGLEAFTDKFQKYIVKNYLDIKWFDNIMEESISIIISEYAKVRDDKFSNELIRYLYNEGYLHNKDFEKSSNGKIDFSKVRESVDIDTLLNYAIEDRVKKEKNSIEYCKRVYGHNAINDDIKKFPHLLDLDSLVNECITRYGAGYFLATYDEQEIELEDDYYTYRIN